MEDVEFYTVEKEASAEIVEKKSRFIANIFNVENKQEAEEKLKEIKKKYYDAKHNCFAFKVLDKNGIIEKSSDDGEPSGTAGAQILNVIKKNNLNNTLIVVTRYFGGILLGTGGLTRAYSEAAAKALKNANLVKQEPGVEAIVELQYADNEKFKFYCEKNDINIIQTDYNASITYIIELNEKECKKILMRNKTNNAQLDFNIDRFDVICRKSVKKPK